MNLAISLRYMMVGKPTDTWSIRWYSSDDWMLLSKKYDVGVFAVLNEKAIKDAAAFCDGLIIPGSGTDIPPAYYGGPPLPNDPPVDEYALDSALIKSFLDAGKPILGVCGGHQELNVFFGGGLRRMADSKAHENDTAHEHKIHITKPSFLYDVFGAESATVNSYHAWEIFEVAPDLDVVAATEDGVAEAIEWKKHRVYATQWHPELNLKRPEHPEHALFANFLRECEQ